MSLRTALHNNRDVTVKLTTGEHLSGTCRDTDDSGVWLEILADKVSEFVKDVPSSAPQGYSLVMFIPFCQMAWLTVTLTRSEFPELKY